MASQGCVFCEIVAGRASAPRVHQDDQVICFLDHRPLFAGHALVVPRAHVATLAELPVDLMPALLGAAQMISRALEAALGCQGSFVALNNKVSQSVPHLHVHVVPRSKGDGLKGFFWPRHPYRDAAQMEEVRAKVAEAVLADLTAQAARGSR